ncbi:hypothetical protein EC973_005439 [Apophysomyces ossiformis]|uniref:Glutamate decarboxylase n=1 Tax=Apophysomyces ossiformis TaxID=679940 RepID=A0A8H7BS08_9FUNG|nr:hypothetical protein EC973_005439 [Apophysomyces ossiformis]
MLHKQVTHDEASTQAAKKRRTTVSDRTDKHLHSLAYSSRYATHDIPKWELPSQSSEACVAYQLIHDELELDGKPAMNCASFVNTWMEPEAEKLIAANLNKNLADQDQYPAAMEIQSKCVSMLGRLWHGKDSVGTSTIGSSEAVMLGGLAMKKLWQAKRKSENKDTSRPNIIMGNNAQVALEKFARYFDVEARIIPVSKESHYVLDIHKATEACDENTIGIFVILGSTYTGHFEDVQGLSKLLDEHERKTGQDIPIHVDAASGGLVAPFAFPELPWDFVLPRVKSINCSGHKFGLCYPGVGWILWRSDQYLPKELVFELHYLGGTEHTYTLNFSRPACFVIGQYYNFIRLGKEGYRNIVNNILENAYFLANALEETGMFDIVSDLHRPEGVFGWENAPEKSKAHKGPLNPSLPVVAFKFSDRFTQHNPHVKQDAVSTMIRTKGWIVPNYPLPPAVDDISILRVVVRESMTRDMIESLVDTIKETVTHLASLDTSVTFTTKGKSSLVCQSHDEQERVSRSTMYSRPC